MSMKRRGLNMFEMRQTAVGGFIRAMSRYAASCALDEENELYLSKRRNLNR